MTQQLNTNHTPYTNKKDEMETGNNISFQLLKILLLICLILSGIALNAQDNKNAQRRFTVGKGGELDVNLSVGDITIRTQNKNEVSIEIEGVKESEAQKIDAAQSGDRIKVRLEEGQMTQEDTRLIAYVPEEYDLKVRTLSGDLDIKDRIKGRVLASTSGGDIRTNDVAGEVELNTAGGNITTGNIEGDADLSTMGGDIEMGKVMGRVKISTMGGMIRVADVGKSLSATTYGGDITLGNIGGSAHAQTFGGDIFMKNVSGEAEISTAGGSIYCEGANGRLKVSTAGGDIELKNISGALDAKTASGDITVEFFPSGKGLSKITSALGDVTLTVPQTAKARIEATIRLRGAWGGKSEHKIHSDFKEESLSENENEKSIKGVYVLNGGGSDQIEIRTINSDIEILRTDEKKK